MNTVYNSPDSLATSIVAFCRFARQKGWPAGTLQTLAALRATETIGAFDWQLLYFGLRSVLCYSPDQWKEFEQLFCSFWNAQAQRDSTQLQERPKVVSQRLQTQPGIGLGAANETNSPEDEGRMVTGASAVERLKRLDFSEVACADQAALERLSLLQLRQMSTRVSRRLKVHRRGERVDLRRSIRQNIGHGGDLAELAYKERKPEKRSLVILLDVSGSMNLYSLFLIRFAYALQKFFRRVETFLFSTSVVDVSDALRARKLPDALAAVSRTAVGWSGGTKIGGSLREFNLRHGRRILKSKTVFMILSDGWDTGTPGMLASELRDTKRRVEKVIWLNPLLGLKDYEPVTRGMKAALPYVDVFAPAHNLQSLLALEKYL